MRRNVEAFRFTVHVISYLALAYMTYELGFGQTKITEQTGQVRIGMFIMVVFFCKMFVSFTRTGTYLQNYVPIHFGVGAFFVLAKTVFDGVMGYDAIPAACQMPPLLYILLKVPFLHATLLNVFLLWCFCVRYVTTDAKPIYYWPDYMERDCGSFSSRESYCRLVDYSCIFFGITCVFVGLGYRQEYFQRRQFDLQADLEKAQVRSQEILHNRGSRFSRSSSVPFGPRVDDSELILSIGISRH